MAASPPEDPRPDGGCGARPSRLHRPLAAAVAVALLASAPGARAGSLSVEGGRRRIVLEASEAGGSPVLPDLFVVAGTDSVWIDGRLLLRDSDYTIDSESGAVEFSVDIPDTAEIVLAYRYIPLDVNPVYRSSVLESPGALPPGFGPESMLVSTAPGERAAPPPAHGLRVGGAKTFGITVGSDRDASLEQSLRLSVSGNVTRDVSVNAYLSDQNTPLLPEGDTEELRALDKVLIEIEGENVGATLGDYELHIDGGPLADFRREETGAMVRASVGPTDVVLAGARSAGRFVGTSFRGIDGKQGPYLLTDGSGSTGITVVAGSERIWLNGRELKRGRDRDYIIDYASGELTFTERVHIVSESEIAADYEYTDEDFERDTYAGRARLATRDGAAALGLSFFREADDAEASTSTEFSAAELAVLEAAGDDPELAHDDGIDSVGVGLGDYVRLEEGVFEYAGSDSGDYDLSFERADGGAYDYDYVLGHYVYAGPGAGSFELGRRLPMPTEHGLVSADGHISLARDGYLDVSTALSSLDLNTYSDRDDDDNLGNAQVVSARLPELRFGAFGGSGAALSVEGRRVGGAFSGMGRFRETTYRERWELTGLDMPSGEVMVRGTSELRLGSGGELRLSHAYLERGEAVESNRTEFDAEVRPSEGSRVWADGRFVDLRWRGTPDTSSARERTLLRGGGEITLGPVRPGLSYAHDERTEDDSGERYDEYGTSLRSASAGPLTFAASYAHRLTDADSGDGWDRASVTRTEEYSLGLEGWRALRLTGNVVRRHVEFEPGFERPDTRYDLASLRLSHSSMDGGVTGEARYSVTSTEVEELEKYVTEEDDVEITRIVGTGNYVPVTDITASTKWKLAPGRRGRGAGSMPEPTAFGRFLSTLTLTSDVKLRETSRSDDRLSLYLLSPDVIQGGDTVSGEISGRHTLRYLAPGNAVSVRLVATTRDVLDRRYTNDVTRRRERAGTADVKFSLPGGITYRVQGDAGRRERESVGAADDYSVDERAVLGEATFRRFGPVEIGITSSVEWQDERLSDTAVTLLSAAPSVTYRLASRGTVTATVTRTDVRTEEETLLDRPYLADGRPPGVSTRWRVGGDYRFNRYLTGSLSYVGESEPDADVRHTMDLRVNAFF